jgi:hypothetical protein
MIGNEKAGQMVNEPDPFRIVECHYPYLADEPVVLVSAAAQRVLGSDLGSSLVPDLARRVRSLVHPGPSPRDDTGIAALTLSDGRQICGVCGHHAIILGAPQDIESELSTSLGADEIIGPTPDGDTPEQHAKPSGTDLRSRFRAAFLSTDPGDSIGDDALRDEAVRLVVLHRQAIDLLKMTGAADLAEIYADDPEMLAALP